MSLLFRLISFFVFLTLIEGCTIKNIIKSPDTKQCLSVCTQRFVACRKVCVNNCAACSRFSKKTTILNYAKYVHEEQVKGGYVTRGLKSYRDPLQCRKVTCNCVTDLSVCEQNCTGIIHKKLRTVPYCI